MAVLGFNHINIRTMNVVQSVSFYVEVLGLVHAEQPPVNGEVGNWLHDTQGNPIIHLRSKQPDAASTGPVDHVALHCVGKADIIAKLQAREIPHMLGENLVANGVTQLFVKDPSGVLLELSFEGE